MSKILEKVFSSVLAVVLAIGLMPTFNFVQPEAAYAEGEWNDKSVHVDIDSDSILTEWTPISQRNGTTGAYNYPGQWSFDNSLRAIVNAENTDNFTGFYNPSMQFTDFSMTMKMRTTDSDDDGMGFMFRTSEAGVNKVTTYVFVFDCGGIGSEMIAGTDAGNRWHSEDMVNLQRSRGSIAGLYKITDASFECASTKLCQASATSNLHFTLNHWHDVKLTLNGSHIVIEMDGKKEIDFVDPDPIVSGSFGFFSHSQPQAQYKDISYDGELTESTLTFNANGKRAKLCIGDERVTEKSLQVINSRPFSPEIQSITATRSGYTFSGWNTQADGSGTHYAADYFTQPGARVEFTEDTTLYAQWSRGSYTVAYDANGGTDKTTEDVTGMPAQTVKFDADDFSLRALNFEKPGYHFTGWNTAADGSGKAFADGQKIEENLTESIGDTVTLYAQWAANTFTFKFEPNGATEGLDTMPNQTVTYDQPEPAFLKENTFIRPGYEFQGWKSYEPGPGDITDLPDGYQVNNFTSRDGFTDTDPIVLLAQWGAGEYTIAFDANGGQGAMEPLNCTFDQEYSLPGHNYTRTGYDFTGWCKVKDGNTVNPDDFVEDVATIRNYALDGETVTLYAQWAPHKYTVKYQGGAGASGTAPTDQRCTYDETYSMPQNTFTRSGYGFDGWKCVRGLEDTTSVHQPGHEFTNLSADDGAEIVYEAQWSPLKYIIRFDGNGATSGHLDDITVTFDTFPKLGWTTAYSRDGYQVDDTAWTRVDTGEKYECGMNIPNNLTTVHNKVITFRAEWAPNTYFVNYEHGGFGNGSMSTQRFAYGTAQNLATNTFTRPGYAFTGWKANINGEEKTFADGQSVTDLTTINNQNIYLVAQWEKVSYSCTYNGNGSDGGSMDPTPIEYYLHPFYLAPNAFTKTGYTFVEWNNKPDGSGISKANKAEVRYHWGADQDHPGSSSDYNLIAYAQWRPNTYDVVFDAGTGSGTQEAVTYTYDKPANLPHRTVYKDSARFLGWKAVIDGKEAMFADEAEILNLSSKDNDVIVMQAQWAESAYTVSFRANGGNGMMADQTFGYNDITPLAKNSFYRLGYIFTGWNTQPMGTGLGYRDQAELFAAAPVDTTLILYAQWAPTTYTVRFDGNGADSGNLDDVVMSWNDEYKIPEDAFAREGYVLAGYKWDGGSCSDGAVISRLTQENASVVTLKAMWAPARYKVTFDANGASGVMSDIAAAYDSDIVLPACGFCYTGKTFTGWNTKADGTGQAFAAGQTVSNLTSEHVANVVLYAQWKSAEYKVSFVGGAGASGSMEGMSAVTDAHFDVPACGFTKPGYAFTGWLVSGGRLDGQILRADSQCDALATSDGEQVTLVAQWSPITYKVVIHSGYGDDLTYEVSCEYNRSYDIPSMFKRAGHAVAGYNFDSARAADVPVNAKIFNWADTQDAIVEIYTVWTENTYAVSFDANGGKMIGNHDMTSVRYTEEFNLPDMSSITRDGYKFVAWSTSANGMESTFKAGQRVSGLADSGKITLYAQWEKEQAKPPVGPDKPGDSNTNSGGNANTGGNTNMGDNTNTGGNTNAGGNTNTGGNSNTSGNTNANGNVNTGGNTNLNGNTSGNANANTGANINQGGNAGGNANGNANGNENSNTGQGGNDTSGNGNAVANGDHNADDGNASMDDGQDGNQSGENDNLVETGTTGISGTTNTDSDGAAAGNDALTSTGDQMVMTAVIAGVALTLVMGAAGAVAYVRRRKQ